MVLTYKTEALRTPRSRRSRGIASTLAVLLAVTGMQAGASAAYADDAALLPTVAMSNGGLTEVAGYDDEIQFQAQIVTPAGVNVEAGAVTTIVLPESVRVSTYDKTATAAMAKAPSYDTSTRTFTVTWKALTPGSFNSFPFVGQPSPVADSASTFQVSAVTRGTTASGSAFELSAVSDAIAASGAFDSELVKPGDWALPEAFAMTLQINTANTSAPAVRKAGDVGGSFTDMQWRVRFDDPSATLPRANLDKFETRFSHVSNLLVDTNDSYVRSHGAMNYAGSDSFLITYSVNAKDIEPGLYSVPMDLVDVRPDGTEVLVGSTELRLTVPTPEATEIGVRANTTRDSVLPGELLRYQFTGTYQAAAALRDIRYVIPIPEGTTPASFATARRDSDLAQTVEYSENGTDWRVLSGKAVWSFDSVPDLGGVRFVGITERDSQNEYASGAHTLTLAVNDSVDPGAVITTKVEALTFIDPVAGESAQDLAETTAREVTVVSDHAAAPQIGGVTSLAASSALDFGKPYYNGQRILQDIRLNSAGSTPLEDPYMFALVPSGMSVESVGGVPVGANGWHGLFTTMPAANPGQQLMLNYAGLLGTPVQAQNVGSIKLSGGDTLYYWKSDGVGLTGRGAPNAGYEQMFSNLQFKLNGVQQGDHTVQVGVGSAVRDDFTVSSLNRDFAEASLADPKVALGDYAAVGDEVTLALRDIGISTEQLLVKTLPFSVPGQDSIAVDTVIQGSEDAKPITGNGIATTKLGATTEYTINVKNTGTYAYSSFQFIDVFPYAGDTFVLNGASRGSQYDLNITDRPVVTLNGKAVDAIVQVSTSTTPPRFDASGADVPSPGATWESIAGGTDGAKALRVTLGSGVKFTPNDVLRLDFVASVPLDAPRDGSVANNSVAYRLDRPGFAAGLETDAGGVKVPAVATDFELSGQLLDSHGDGINGGVEMHLFKVGADGTPVATGDESLPATSGGARGVWGFVDIDANASYRVKPVPLSDSYTLDASTLDSEGFLKYTHRGAASTAANGEYDVTSFDGKSEFRLGDAAGDVTHWIKDLRARVSVSTDVTGALVFVDKTGAVKSLPSLFKLDWKVELQDGDGSAIARPTGLDAETGGFEFLRQDLAAGKHLLQVILPAGSGLTFAADNQPTGFDPATGVYTQEALVPGTGIADLSIRMTDAVAPKITSSPAADRKWNPTTVAVEATDRGTHVTGFAWSLTGPGGYSETGTAAKSPIAIPRGIADGSYTMTVEAVDFAGNRSASEGAKFTVDKTGPVIVAGTPALTHEQDAGGLPTTPSEWRELFGITATDAGIGALDTDSWSVKWAGPTGEAAAPTSGDALGEWTATFSVDDSLGNTSEEPASATLTIVDTTAPKITADETDLTFEFGSRDAPLPSNWRKAFGLRATDKNGVDASSWAFAWADGKAPAADATGVFSGEVTVKDTAGNVSAATKVTVTHSDTIRPVITASDAIHDRAKAGEEPSYSVAEWLALFTVTATDETAAAIGTGVDEATWTVDSSRVDFTTWKKTGYPVTFTVKDLAGNVAKQVTQTLMITDTVPPAITVADPELAYEQGATQVKLPERNGWWKAFGAVATDAEVGIDDDTYLVKWSGPAGSDAPQLTIPGSYTAILSVKDEANNAATATATVTVADTIAPVITAGSGGTHAATVGTLTPAQWVALLKMRATDTSKVADGSGVDAGSWVVDSSLVQWEVAGTYEVGFVVADVAGNVSAPVVGKLTIQAAPVIRDDAELSLLTGEGVAVTATPAASVTTEGTLAKLTEASVVAAPEHGAVTVGPRAGEVTFTPNAGWSGSDTFAVSVADDLGQAVTLEYSVTVQAVLTVEDGTKKVAEGGSVSFVERVTTTGTVVKREILEQPKQGTAVLGSVIFEAGDAQPGEYSFVVRYTDNVGQTADAAYTATVQGKPISSGDIAVTAAYGTEVVTIDALGAVTGTELQPLTSESLTQPASGGVTISAQGLLEFRPASGYAGTESFVATVVDDLGQSVRVNIAVTIEPAPAKPGGNGAGDGSWLSSTGGKVTGGAALAAALLAAGVLLLAVRRRREASERA